MLEAGLLEHVAFDDLVDEPIDMERNEPDDEILPDLKKLRESYVGPYPRCFRSSCVRWLRSARSEGMSAPP
jgi:hypothetical protein